ncbi:hypothetical protein EV421DRAFT_1733446 [Armillaria borealis]|uniref:Uncharacterized protein n=1 Tax=Armillaria borealis TaxID=47425 RepID=A0AA39JUB1_9AGAR|nr:hypothetical protein EV421DRAFT_1733446 [Armillaria borealis]
MASHDVDYQQLEVSAMWVLRTDRLGTSRVVVPFETYALPLVLMARVLSELHKLPVNIPHLPKERALHPQSFRAPSLLPLVWSGDVDEATVVDMVENRAVKSIVIGVRMGGELRQNTLSRVDALRKRGTSITLW